MTEPRCLRFALAYAAQGWRVLPLKPRDKVPLGRLVEHGCLDATADEVIIRRWWASEPTANVGVATGPESGIFVVDIDGPVGAVNWWHWEAQHGAVHTLAQRTGREDGGRQLVISWPDGWTVATRSALLPGIDSRGAGGYIAAAPSIHSSGRRYRWEGRVPVAQPSEAILSLVGATNVQLERPSAPRPVTTDRPRLGDGSTAYGASARDQICRDLSSCCRGGRQQLAWRSAVRLVELEDSRDLPSGEAERVLRDALGRCGYMDDPRPQRGERGLQGLLQSARGRVR